MARALGFLMEPLCHRLAGAWGEHVVRTAHPLLVPNLVDERPLPLRPREQERPTGPSVVSVRAHSGACAGPIVVHVHRHEAALALVAREPHELFLAPAVLALEAAPPRSVHTDEEGVIARLRPGEDVLSAPERSRTLRPRARVPSRAPRRLERISRAARLLLAPGATRARALGRRAARRGAHLGGNEAEVLVQLGLATAATTPSTTPWHREAPRH